MSVRRGRDWGEPGEVPADAVFASTDREASAAVSAARRANRPVPAICLVGGDLARTLGADGGSSRLNAGEGVRVAIDVGAVLLDGRLHWFVAHLVARRSWLRGRVVVAANAAFIGRWNIAPRAHPGDGRLDLLDGNPSIGDRWKARARLPAGTHLPHPSVTSRRIEAAQIDLGRPTPVHLDGFRMGSARSLSIRVEAAAVEIWI